MSNKEQFINWDVPKGWLRKHRTEITRTAIATSSIIGLIAIAITSYSLGESNALSEESDTIQTTSPTLNLSYQRLMNFADQINNAQCGDVILVESSYQPTPQSAEPDSQFWKAIIFGDYPSSVVNGDRVRISVDDNLVEIASVTDLDFYRIKFFESNEWLKVGMEFVDGPMTIPVDCSRGGYEAGLYRKVNNLTTIGGPGLYQEASDIEALCAVSTADQQVTQQDAQSMVDMCYQFWGTDNPWNN